MRSTYWRDWFSLHRSSSACSSSRSPKEK